MKLLLDTCTFLWLVLGDKGLPKVVRHLFVDPDNEIYLSAISAWEISIKYKLGKLSLPRPPDEFVSQERAIHMISALPLFEKDIQHLTKLPDLHRDPFDRMLVCQAIEGALSILTPDSSIRQYPIRTIWETI